MALYGFGGYGAAPQTKAPQPQPLYPTSATGISTDILAEASRQGLFDPGGSPRLRALLQRLAVRSGANRMRSSATLNRILGLDPVQARQALVDVNRQNTGGIADFLNQAELSQAQDRQGFLNSLLGTRMGIEEQQRQEREARRGRLQALLGQLLGIGVGSFAGGYGESAGRNLGGGYPTGSTAGH